MATILFMQRSLRKQRVFRDRSQPLDSFDDSKLISRYRFPRRIIFDLIDGVDEQLRPYTERSHAIPTQLQVLCTLRYIAKADFFSEVGDVHGVSKSSVSVCLPRVCQALCEHLQNIKFPSSVHSLRKIKDEFHSIARFLNVVGAIDGTLIPIKGMGTEDEHIYVSRKKFHALNIQGVVDAEMRFLNINCRFPGSAHDAYIMSNSTIPDIIAKLPEGGCLLGDSGYPLKDFLMTPWSGSQTKGKLDLNCDLNCTGATGDSSATSNNVSECVVDIHVTSEEPSIPCTASESLKKDLKKSQDSSRRKAEQNGMEEFVRMKKKKSELEERKVIALEKIANTLERFQDHQASEFSLSPIIKF
ncbi:putative nuclease HARBI1 [Saccostrea cucullata]|uniref:putative nuclease HARBI1 n=1 Tax=Saccostrea cuccullata TaxID=36930 RepID=UPI002ED105A2